MSVYASLQCPECGSFELDVAVDVIGDRWLRIGCAHDDCGWEEEFGTDKSSPFVETIHDWVNNHPARFDRERKA